MTKTVAYTYKNEEVDSSAIDAVWYDLVNQELYVEFPNGAIAGYKGVPSLVVKEMLTANSIGSYFARSIKPYYKGVSSDVEFKPYNSLSNSNTNPAIIGTPPFVPPKPPVAKGKYEVAFTVEGVLQFEAEPGNIMEALEFFTSKFKQGEIVRVRSIKEIV